MKKPISNIFRYALPALISAALPFMVQSQNVVAVNDYAGTNINNAVTVNVLANDQVPSGAFIDKIVLVNNCTAVKSNNNLIITPNRDFTGVALLNYTVCADTTRKNCSCGLVALNVSDQPLPIYAEQTLYVKPGQKTYLTLPTLYNTSITASSTDSGGVLRLVQGVQYSYTPRRYFTGHDQLTVHTYDDNGNIKTLLLNFEVLNIPPVRKYASDDYYNTRPNKNVSFDLLANDKTAYITGLQIDSSHIYGGSIVYQTYGAGIFRPQTGFKGVATIPYSIAATDGSIEFATAFITVSDFAPAREVFQITAPKDRLTQFVFRYQSPVAANFTNLTSIYNVNYGSLHFFPQYNGTVNGKLIIDSNIFIYTPPSIYIPGQDDGFTMRYCLSDDCTLFKNVQLSVHLDTVSNCGSGVFAGDTNNDGVVDMADLYAVARNMGSYGTARTNGNIDWRAQCASDWGVKDAANNNLDLKFGDANGDGIISAADTSAISYNFGNTNTIFAEKTAQPSSLAVQLISPVTAVHPGDMVEIQVSIGSTEIPAIDLSGVSFNVNFDPKRLNANTIGVDFNKAGFMVQYNAALWLNQITGNGVLAAALVRSLAKPASGHGTIGTVHGVVIEDVAGFKQGDQQYLTVSIPDMLATNGDGQPIALKGTEIKIPILPKDDKAALQNSDLHIFPNPSNVRAEFYLNGTNEMQSVTVYDAAGRNVKTVIDIHSKQLSLPTNDMAHGLYIVNIATTKGNLVKKLVVE